MKTKFALIAAAAALSFSAHAQTGFYAGAELGSASLKDETRDVARSFVNEFGGSATVTQSSAIGFGRIFGGYQINKFVAAELGYLHASGASMNVSGVTGGAVAYTAVADLTISGLDASAIITPFQQPGLNGLFFRAGVTSYETKLDVRATAGASTASGVGKDSGMGTVLGVGYDLPVGPGSFRFQLNTMQKIAGKSDNSSTAISAGYLFKF